jgi:hypothetical protein
MARSTEASCVCIQRRSVLIGGVPEVFDPQTSQFGLIVGQLV